ncbi:MAG: ribonuclease J [Oscillospiraceae bacterium]|jgi:ribonuclease J|nr:ribonuclease J [Oscillospiraceae bacterium]
MADKLKIVALGGLNEVGKNITVYEYKNDIIVVDCGMGFPDDDMYGVDVVVPNVTYLAKNREKIRGIFLTHGHEDHIGAIPYVLRDITAPIYATPMTLGLVKLKLEEHRMMDIAELIEIQPGVSYKAGCFSVEPIHINHSIAGSVSFAITTPVGIVIQTGDFKIDPTPIHDEITDLTRFGELGRKGVLALLADSTNVERPGFSNSERRVGMRFDNLFESCKNRIIVTTFASNVHRVQQIMDIAARYGRKVAVTGRSMENMLKVAVGLGYMTIPSDTLVDIDKIKNFPDDKAVIITTGSQGETMSALYRMAFSGHKYIEIKPGDRVVISASAVPGNETTVSKIINELFRKGAEVMYRAVDELHVSGHGFQEELKIMIALTKPKFFIPVHGEHRHLKLHAVIARDMGIPPKNVLISDIGQIIEVSKKDIGLNGSVQSGKIFVDGTGIGDVGSIVLRDRKHLAQDGMLVIVVGLSQDDGGIVSGPDIITRGFVYVKENASLIEELRTVVLETLVTCEDDGISDWTTLKTTIKAAVSQYLYKATRRNPMVLTVLMEV